MTSHLANFGTVLNFVFENLKLKEESFLYKQQKFMLDIIVTQHRIGSYFNNKAKHKTCYKTSNFIIKENN